MSLTRVLKRGGVPYIYDPENTKLTEEESSLPQEGDWIEVTNGNSLSMYEWHEPVEPVVYVAPKIRVITKRAFMHRLFLVERVAIRKSTDDIIIDIHEDLKLSSSVDLDLKDVKEALLIFVDAGILVASRIAVLLKDGTLAEEFKGF